MQELTVAPPNACPAQWWRYSCGHMKNIDVKSLIIGALLTSTIFLGVAATSTTDKWDGKQMWQVISALNKVDGKGEAAHKIARTIGMEPFSITQDKNGVARVWYRKRIK